MRRSTALRLLPSAHARILELADAGFESAQLAPLLGVDPSAVGPLLRIARSKLAALEALDEPPATDVMTERAFARE
jgi:DNA-directed RNA polymerase specialized sigma24 family protein